MVLSHYEFVKLDRYKSGKDSLLAVGRLTTRDWTSADSSWLFFVVSFYMIFFLFIIQLIPSAYEPWNIRSTEHSIFITDSSNKIDIN